MQVTKSDSFGVAFSFCGIFTTIEDRGFGETRRRGLCSQFCSADGVCAVLSSVLLMVYVLFSVLLLSLGRSRGSMSCGVGLGVCCGYKRVTYSSSIHINSTEVYFVYVLVCIQLTVDQSADLLQQDLATGPAGPCNRTCGPVNS